MKDAYLTSVIVLYQSSSPVRAKQVSGFSTSWSGRAEIEHRRPCPPPFVINNQAHLLIVRAQGPYSAPLESVRGGICSADRACPGILGH